MKKLIKILAINLAIFSFLALLCIYFAEKHFYHSAVLENQEVIDLQNKVYNKQNQGNFVKLKYKKAVPFNYNKYKENMRPVNYFNGNKRPILFFGCSYTEGFGLDDNQTLPYLVGKKTNRTTYNRGIGGSGTQFMYYQLSHPEIKKEVPDAEYIIYTFIWDHLYRLNNYQLTFFGTDINLRYKQKGNKLEEVKTQFGLLYPLFSVKKLQNYISEKKFNQEQLDFKLFNLTLAESIKITKQKYPDAKVILIEYPDSGYLAPNYKEGMRTLPDWEVKKLEKMGFIVVKAEDLVGKKIRSKAYRIEDEDHPNKKAFEELSDKLIEKFDL